MAGGGGVGGGGAALGEGGSGSASREATLGAANESNRQTSNPPSVRSTPSPVPSNFSSGTSNKFKRARSILTSERSEESESNSEVECSRTEGNDSNVDTEGEGGSELGLNDEIELVFKPHPTEMADAENPLKERYLKTTANASGNYQHEAACIVVSLIIIFPINKKKLVSFRFSHPVDHLIKYLAMRLTLDLDTELPEADRVVNFCIYIAPQPSQLLVLNGNQTLHQVNDKFWKVSLDKSI